MFGALIQGKGVACAMIGCRQHALNHAALLKTLTAPRWLLKIIPDIDCQGPRFCEFVAYCLEHIPIRWLGPNEPGPTPNPIATRYIG